MACRRILGKLLDVNYLGAPGSQSLRPRTMLGVCEDDPGSGIADDVLNPGAGIGRIKRDVAPTRFESPNQGDGCRNAVAQKQRHGNVRRQASVLERARHAIGGLIELFVGDSLPRGSNRDSRPARRRLLFEPGRD